MSLPWVPLSPANRDGTTNHIASKSPTNPGIRSGRTYRLFRCNGKHPPENCRFKDATCHFCHKTGHITPASLSRIRAGKEKLTHQITTDCVSQQKPAAKALVEKEELSTNLPMFYFQNNDKSDPIRTVRRLTASRWK